MEDPTVVTLQQISELLKLFSLRAYSSKLNEAQDEKIIDICIDLWKLDYGCEVIENKNGSLCSTYPSKLVVPVYEIGLGGEIVTSSPLSDAVYVETKPPSKEVNQSSKRQLSCQSSHAESKAVDEEHLLDKAFSYTDAKETSPAPTFSAVVAKSAIGNKSIAEHNGTLQGCRTGGSPHKFTLREYFYKAHYARCRYRFPIPSLLCKGKYISRSATLSCFIDVIGKQILHSSDSQPDIEDDYDSTPRHSNDVDRARLNDIKLLEAIGTSSIVDLMVENKKVKYNINVSSSEKADKENRYSKFSIMSIPYPGCEFFRKFTSQKFNSSRLFYNWEQTFNDAALSLVEDSISTKVTTEWSDYKNWDLRKMTENYLKLILRHVVDEGSKETGFLVHCISGWDRTPLFVSLIRLSLWADGLVHCSLDAKQMLFFTLAYDWYLFGHQLPDRLKSKENILYFCFEFLEEIYKDSFMDPVERRERHPSSGSCTSGAYDSATGGIETPASSFGSATSLASSSSSNNHPPAPSAPPSNPTPPPGLVKVSPLKSTHESEGSESCSWPFNKENGFSFEGISENDGGSPAADLLPATGEGTAALSRNSCPPSRSPLKERNKGSPKSTTPSPAGVKAVSGSRKGNLNGFLREFAGRRSRKSSTVEPPLIGKLVSSSGSESGDWAGHSSQDASGSDVVDSSSSRAGVLPPSKCASNPVPVPGGRSRHNSSSSSVGSWQFLSTSDPLKESFSMSSDSHRSSRTSLTADMIDSTHTIKEEATPSSSLESSQSIIVFNRKRRLSEVREMFFKVYSQEVSSLYPEWSFLTDIVQNICQKLGS